MEPSIQGLRGPRTTRLRRLFWERETGSDLPRDSRSSGPLLRTEPGARDARAFTPSTMRRRSSCFARTRTIGPAIVLNRFHGALGPGFPAPFQFQPTTARSENTRGGARRRIRHPNYSKHEPALSCAECNRAFAPFRRSNLRNRPRRFVEGHDLCRRGKELQRTVGSGR